MLVLEAFQNSWTSTPHPGWPSIEIVVAPAVQFPAKRHHSSPLRTRAIRTSRPPTLNRSGMTLIQLVEW